MNQGFEYRARVTGDGAGARLADYLARRYPKFSRDEWVSRIRAGRVSLDGAAAHENTVLIAGQDLVWARPPWEEPPVPLSFAVLYDRAHVLAVAKPSGLPTLPGGGAFVTHTLLSRVRSRFPGARPLHRLGRATSGIVLFSTSTDVYAKIAQQWRDGRVLKIYRALVAGCPRTDRFDIDTPIGAVPHPLLDTVHAATAAGKPSHSEVTVVERRDTSALVDVRITTGRPHQIRIHLAAAGHPLVGDPLYPAGGRPDHNCRALPGDGGYHLHARVLGFEHPVSGEHIEITCAPPPVLRPGVR